MDYLQTKSETQTQAYVTSRAYYTIEDTNMKECAIAKDKSLFEKTNIVEETCSKKV